MLRKINLSLVEKLVVLDSLAQGVAPDHTTTSIAHSLRYDLGLRGANRMVDKLNAQAQAEGLGGPSWEELLALGRGEDDPEYREEVARRFFSVEEVSEMLGRCGGSDYTTEEANLQWLQRRLDEQATAPVKSKDAEGKETESPNLVHPARAEAQYLTYQALSRALHED
jgi:hypothetical protein